MFNYQDLSLSLAKLVEAAGMLAQRERTYSKIEFKEDGSIVTQADRKVEIWLRSQLPKLIPNTTVWGEEQGLSEEGENGLWIVDPIDGTSNFANGIPLWGVSIALYHKGEIQIGAISIPDLSEIYIAIRGHGALLNFEALPQIPSGPVLNNHLVGYPDGLIKLGHKKWVGKIRHLGSAVIHGTFFCTQRFRAMVTKNLRLYDIAAVICLARELGADIHFADSSEFREKDFLRGEKIEKVLYLMPKDCKLPLF